MPMTHGDQTEIGPLPPGKFLVVDYKASTGAKRLRAIEVMHITWRISEWHEGAQWIAVVICEEDDGRRYRREFAIKGIERVLYATDIPFRELQAVAKLRHEVDGYPLPERLEFWEEAEAAIQALNASRRSPVPLLVDEISAQGDH